MSRTGELPCGACLRRTWLVSALAAHIEQLGGRIDDQRALFALDDLKLVDALTRPGKRRLQVRQGYETFQPAGARRRCRAAGLTALCRHDARYPRPLLEMADAPAVLHVAGSLAPLDLDAAPAVAIVGARRASGYGLEVARSLGRGLATAGLTVISGMALGIDAAAHEGALEAQGSTIAVLAGAAEIPYPASKRSLHARVRRNGAVISELPPGFRARRWCFPARNRVIAGLARLTVVVEAAERSGALITTKVAGDLGRDVGAVPGRITSPLATGPNALIGDGAALISGAQKALDVACGVGMRVADPGRTPSLAPRLRRVLLAVASGTDTPAALVASGVSPADAVAGLGELELHGLLRRSLDGRYLPVAP
ncbi:MAG: DNA-processing protein DprA [Actinomycetota bacterium]|nr:DNA-processing protein DprA [Actinomycetota bacterium]